MPKAIPMDVSDNGKSKRKAVSSTQDVELDESEPEYEIDQILDHRAGMFPGGKMGYFVSWKGYEEDDNSWVNEDDAEGAAELIKEYWVSNKEKSRPRKSTGSTKAISVDVEETNSSRKRKSGKATGDETPEKVVKPVSSTASTKKAPASQGRPSKKPKVDDAAPNADEYTDMKSYMSVSSWEKMKIFVETVEHVNDTLVVYFEFTGHGGKRQKARCESEICNKKFPHTLLRFYEQNLKWRQADD